MDHGLPKVSKEHDAVEKIDLVNNVHNTTVSEGKKKIFYVSAARKRASILLIRQIDSLMSLLIEKDLRRKAAMVRIANPPGFTVRKVLEFFCSRRTVEYEIEPMHAEYLVEYFDALSSGMTWKAFYIKIKMNFFLIYGVTGIKFMSFLDKFIQAAIKSKTGK